jgi:hypothetical protein
MNTEKIQMEQTIKEQTKTIKEQKKNLEIDQSILDKYIGYLAEIQNDLFNFEKTVNLNSQQTQDLLQESNNQNDQHLRENLTALLKKREEQRSAYQLQQEQQLQLQQLQLQQYQLRQYQQRQYQQQQYQLRQYEQQQYQLQQQLQEKDSEIENLKNQLTPLGKRARLELENEELMRIIEDNGLENKVEEAYPNRVIKRAKRNFTF